MLRAVGKHNGHRGIGGFGVGVTRRSVVSERPKRTMRAESKNVLVQRHVRRYVSPVPLRGRPAAHGRRLRDRAATVATARARLRDHFSSRIRIRADRPTSHLCDPRRLWWWCVRTVARRARAAGARARAGPGRGRVGAHTDRAYPGYGIPYTLQPVTLLGSYIHCRLLSISEAHTGEVLPNKN